MSDELPGVVEVNNYRFLHLKKNLQVLHFRRVGLVDAPL